MAILNPDHLLEQAARLLEPISDRTTVRQVDRRRAISSAYYAVFHFTLAAVADEFVGRGRLGKVNARYGLVYRSLDHKALESLCNIARRETPLDKNSKYAKYVPEGKFEDGIREFASLVVQLKEKRHSADYDPNHWVQIADAATAIESARSAIEIFNRMNSRSRKLFLTLLVFPPR